jgi:predicted Zn-ribbon and HTH transcriptional regulator
MPEKPDVMERSMRCDDCSWNGKLGEIIAADKLRCPKCRSERVGYSVPDTPATVQ